MLASHLADAVAAWARARKALTLELSVTDRSEAAAALYERLGFVPTGKAEPLASNPEILEVSLSRLL
jgi:ribosomal protein S18 acetylase RimI-like enzyme